MNSGRGTLDMSGRCKEAPPLKRNAERRVSLVLGHRAYGAPKARNLFRHNKVEEFASSVFARRASAFKDLCCPNRDKNHHPGVPPEGSRGYPRGYPRRYPRGYPQRPRLFKNIRVQNPVPSCSKTERSETSGRGTQSRRRLRPFFLTLLSSERHTCGFRGAGFAVI